MIDGLGLGTNADPNILLVALHASGLGDTTLKYPVCTMCAPVSKRKSSVILMEGSWSIERAGGFLAVNLVST